METRRQDRDILSHQFRGQQGGGTSTQLDKDREKLIPVLFCFRGIRLIMPIFSTYTRRKKGRPP